MPLYGHEMNDEISPKEAGLGIFVKMDKDDFIGKKALEEKGVPTHFVEELDEQDVAGFCNTLPAGQFTKSSTEYYQYIENAVSNYKKSIRRTQLKNLWLEKTGTKESILQRIPSRDLPKNGGENRVRQDGREESGSIHIEE